MDTNGISKAGWTIPALLYAAFLAISIAGYLVPGALISDPSLMGQFHFNSALNAVAGAAFLASLLPRRIRNGSQSVAAMAYLFIIYNMIPLIIITGSGWARASCAALAAAAAGAFAYDLRNGASIRQVELTRGGRLASGIVLALFSALFMARGAANVVGFARGEVPIGEFAVSVADVALCSLWLAVAIAVLADRPFGRRAVFPAYLHASALFVSLLAFLAINPVLTGEAVSIVDVGAIAIMSLPFVAGSGLLAARVRREA